MSVPREDLEYACCAKCGDEVLMRDLSASGLCIECQYEAGRLIPAADLEQPNE